MSQDAQLQSLSLLSLSIAAAHAAPIPASPLAGDAANRTLQGATTNTTTHLKHRRLSSAGRSRRRLSDARDAATRPFLTSASLQTASASLAALSLASPTVSHRPPVKGTSNGAQPILQVSSNRAMSDVEHVSSSVDESTLSVSPPPSRTPLASSPVNINGNVTKSGRKRGTIFTCESCSKVYRHPSCLIKHRWEHTPQWREASKFVLSKHQQVQLLEAAAILAHLSPSSASLPEDRSLWPSFLSGGLVPPPASVLNSDLGLTLVPAATTTTASPSASSVHTLMSFPVSSSVPASTSTALSAPTALRLHDYAIDEDTSGLTQLRLGMLAMNGNGEHIGVGGPISASVPVPVPVQTRTGTGTREDDALNLLALHSSGGDNGGTGTSGSWGFPTSVPSPRLSHARSHSYSVSHSRSAMAPSHAHAQSLSLSHGRVGGGWSLPRSSVRFRSKSGSTSERSRSASQSVSASEDRSDDEDQDQDHDHEVGVGVFGEADMDEDDEEDQEGMYAYGSRVHTWKSRGGVMREDHEAEVGVGVGADDKGVRRDVMGQTWDGMEMEMEMEMD